MPSNMFRKLTLLVLLIAASAAAQNAALPADVPREQRPPTVKFSFEMPGGQPAQYWITVASTGNAAFRSEETPGQGSAPGEPYMVKFMVAEPMAQRIFELARALNFFQGDFEYHQR